mgnify:CR=1 FL=1
MSSLYISNEKIISQFYSGYQPFPRSWEFDKEGMKATLMFGVNRIEFANEIWHKIFKEIMIIEGIYSVRMAYALDIKSFDLDTDDIGLDRKGILVEYSYDIGDNYRIS